MSSEEEDVEAPGTLEKLSPSSSSMVPWLLCGMKEASMTSYTATRLSYSTPQPFPPPYHTLKPPIPVTPLPLLLALSPSDPKTFFFYYCFMLQSAADAIIGRRVACTGKRDVSGDTESKWLDWVGGTAGGYKKRMESRVDSEDKHWWVCLKLLFGLSDSALSTILLSRLFFCPMAPCRDYG